MLEVSLCLTEPGDLAGRIPLDNQRRLAASVIAAGVRLRRMTFPSVVGCGEGELSVKSTAAAARRPGALIVDTIACLSLPGNSTSVDAAYLAILLPCVEIDSPPRHSRSALQQLAPTACLQLHASHCERLAPR
jgi:hypothetical protein